MLSIHVHSVLTLVLASQGHLASSAGDHLELLRQRSMSHKRTRGVLQHFKRGCGESPPLSRTRKAGSLVTLFSEIQQKPHKNLKEELKISAE